MTDTPARAPEPASEAQEGATPAAAPAAPAAEAAGDPAALAREAAERYLLRNYTDEYAGGWNHPLFADGKVDPTDVGQVGANRFVIGSPDSVIRQVQAHVDALQAQIDAARLAPPTVAPVSTP